jgi:hypothetical protein
MISKHTPITEQEKNKREELRRFYLNNVDMLWNLLIEHSVFTPITEPSQTVMRNWALKHLEDIGILDELKLKKVLVSILEMDAVDSEQTMNALDPYQIY